VAAAAAVAAVAGKLPQTANLQVIKFFPRIYSSQASH